MQRAISRSERDLRSSVPEFVPAPRAFLLNRGLGPPPAARGGATGHVARAVVTEVSLLRASTCVGKAEAHYSSLAVVDFATTAVAYQHSFASHRVPPLGLVARDNSEMA